MTDIQRLIADYVQDGSEAAFRELVERYIDLVYSTAVRLVGDDSHLADDVVQTVFMDLANLAKKLSHEVRLGGWLHRHTCFVASKALRGERRRQAREKEAIELNAQTDHSESHLGQISSLLDEAINQLGSTDRMAVLLRFYERLDFQTVGEAIGTSEAAAQKRVSRALEKLHLLLKHRGVTFSIGALGAALAGEAVTAAPTGLVTSLPGAVLASIPVEAGSLSTFFKLMAVTKFKTGAITALILASVVTPLLLQHQAEAKLDEQETASQRRRDQLARAMEDNQRLTNLLAQAKKSPALSDNQFSQVLRLRSEVGSLMRKVQEMSSPNSESPPSSDDQLASMKKTYAAQVDRLKQWMETNPAEKIPELQNVPEGTWIDAVGTLATDNDFSGAARILRANAEGRVFDTLWPALRKYGQVNNGQFPSDLSALKPYFKSQIDDAILQRYEIVPARNLVDELQPGGDWVITQRAPVNPTLDLRTVYGLTEMRSADERVTDRWTLAR